jgi:hypothetical protein
MLIWGTLVSPSGGMIPASNLMKVVLPVPFSPTPVSKKVSAETYPTKREFQSR